MASGSVQSDSDQTGCLNAARESLLGRFEETILLSALACGPNATADAIKSRMEGHIGFRGMTSVITTLCRLTDKGLMESHEENEPVKRRGGRKRRLFRVTENGRDSVVRSINLTVGLAQAAGLAPEQRDAA